MKTKKPFFQTRIGKVLKGAASGLPFVGGAMANINSEDSGKGKIDKDTAFGQILVGGVILLVLLQALGLINISPELLQSLIDQF